VSRLAEVELAFADDAPLRLVLHAELAATPDEVYGALSDDPATWTWFPGLQGGRFPAGTNGVGDPREVRIGGTTIAETILAADPGRRWAYRVDAMQIPIAKALVEVWDLAEVPATSTRAAATRIVYTFALEPNRLSARTAGPTGAVIATLFAKAARNLDRLLATPTNP
jgi:uncharacterized protein YndB with AHSA1/START domain